MALKPAIQEVRIAKIRDIFLVNSGGRETTASPVVRSVLALGKLGPAETGFVYPMAYLLRIHSRLLQSAMSGSKTRTNTVVCSNP